MESANREQTEREAEDRVRLAAMIDEHADDIVRRWLVLVRADAAAEGVSITDLQDGIHEYLHRLAELLRSESAASSDGVSTWTTIAREHAITRVRLGFDVTQLFHELVILRQITTKTLTDEGVLPRTPARSSIERIYDMIDAAMTASIKSYVDYRDYVTRRAEAEHVGFLTHELKNPLAAAMLATDHLRQNEDRPSQLQLFDVLERNLDRLRKLVENVLLEKRLEVTKLESHPVDLTAGQLFGEAIDVARRAAQKKHLQFVADLDPSIALRADADLTLTAAENLLDNAVKYTDVGQIAVNLEDLPEKVVFHVRDHCGGLSPSELRVLFEPFMRTRAGKPGAGLGLVISRRAIEAQGGTIHAETAGDGCHFWFVLPKVQH